MIHAPRRLFLASGALMMGAGGTALATRPTPPMPEFEGRVTAGNARRFADLIAEQLDRTVSVKVTARPVEGRDFSVSLEAPLLLVFVRGREPKQIAFQGGYSLRDGAFAVDGVFEVKGAGMQQGILACSLEALPGGEVRRLRERPVRKVAF